MKWDDWVLAVFQLSLFLTVFSIGLKATHRDALYLLRYPRSLMVSVLSMAVIMPAFAVSATLILDFHPAVELALVALSVSPVPPFLPLRIMKAGGKPEYTVSLLVLSAALSILVVPVAVAVFSQVYAVDSRRSPMDIVPVVLTSVLLPLGLGLAARSWKPSLADRLSGILPSLAMGLLILSLVFILFDLREAVFTLVGPSTVAALGGFALLGFLVGDLLGGLKPEDRTVLAFATAMRHPGVALVAAHGSSRTDQAVFAAVLMYLLLGILASSLYMAGRRRFETGPGPTRPASDPAGLRPA
jgi:BASS family bile acid:Na+ symporter